MVHTYNHADILWLQFMMDWKWNAISHEKHFALFYVSLTVNLSIILPIDQLNAPDGHLQSVTIPDAV